MSLGVTRRNLARFRVRSIAEEGADEGDWIDRVVLALDHEDAAIRAVAEDWSGDPDASEVHGQVVVVRAEGDPDSAGTVLAVKGEFEVHWRVEGAPKCERCGKFCADRYSSPPPPKRRHAQWVCRECYDAEKRGNHA